MSNAPALHRIALASPEPKRTPAGFDFWMMPELSGAPMPFERNAEIYGEGEPADYVYQVVSGAVRTYRVLNDDRRQVSAFYLPGDVFGLELGIEHEGSAEAIANSKILVGAARCFAECVAKGRPRCARTSGGDRVQTAPGAESHAAADQERAGARGGISSG